MNGPLIVDDVVLVLRASLDGVALAFLADHQVESHLKGGALMRVLEFGASPIRASSCTTQAVASNRRRSCLDQCPPALDEFAPGASGSNFADGRPTIISGILALWLCAMKRRPLRSTAKVNDLKGNEQYARLDTVSPNNQNSAVSFTRDEFESARKTDVLAFHCKTCQANWPPTKQAEIARM